jgi:hypothetical protein
VNRRSETSIWARRSVASSAARFTIRAPLERTASISARWSWMRWSRVMMSHSWRAVWGIQTASSVAGSVMVHGAQIRRP